MDKKQQSIDFEKFAEAYRKKPTIEEYVRLRKAAPGASFGISTTGGLEFVFAQEDQLRSAGVDADTVVAALDGGDREQSRLALCLLEKLIERNALKNSGASHIVSRKKGISDALVNYLVALMLDASDWNDDRHVCPDLMVLIKHQLLGSESEHEVKLRVHEQRSNAVWIAAQLVASGEVPSYRKIARVLGVEPSTVQRWFVGKDLAAEVKEVMALIKDLGMPDPKKRVAE